MKIKLVAIVLGVISIFTLAIFAIKTIEHKSTIKVDLDLQECYSNCNEVVIIPLDDTSLVDEIKQTKIIVYKENLAERKRIAEAKHHAELEVKRITKLKAKEEEKKKYVTVSRGSQSEEDWIVYEATHYSAFCNTGCTGFTALGYDVRRTIYEQGYRVIAVDPSKIKLGSLVEVKTSYGTFKALAGDTGGAIIGYKIDILVENDAVANRLGIENVQVRIIK